MEIKTKFSIGDAVYILDGYKVQHAKVLGIKFEQYGIAQESIIYTFGVFPMRKESECFRTKEELINFLSK